MEALRTIPQTQSDVPATNSPALHLSPEDWARLSAVNARWNDDIVGSRAVVLEVYSPLVRHPENATITLTRDVAYGADPRQCLDIFAPAGAKKAPVLVFIHGGAFTRGSKSVNGDIYDNVLYWFARQGFIGVNVEYRLAPAARFPAGAQDTALAVDWIAANIARYEEIFGPVLALIEVTSYADAIAKANDTEYGLSAAIATRNPRYMHDFARDIESGTVKINRTTTGNLINAPFGGLKRSSTSTFRESGRSGLEFYTQIKTVYRGC